MARYTAEIELPVPIGEAFAYLADMSHCAEWDPGVVAAERVDAGPPRLGSRFRVVVSFLGRRLPFEYALTELAPPHRIVLEADDGAVRSRDEITLSPLGAATRVRYDATVELRGLRRLADPLLQPLFACTGAAAARGLRGRFARARAPRTASRRDRFPARPGIRGRARSRSRKEATR
jgi:carbon monoxide dehydrogenase subunit G